MVARVLFVVAINVLLALAFVWYFPITGILEARGFSQAQIDALLASQGGGLSDPGVTGQQVVESGATQSAPRPAPTPRQPQTGVQPLRRAVATAGVNIRSGPSTSNPDIGLVPQGETVDVLEEPAGGQWIRIRYNGTEGWAYAPIFTGPGGLTPSAGPTAPSMPEPLALPLASEPPVAAPSATRSPPVAAPPVAPPPLQTTAIWSSERVATSSVNIRTGPGTGNPDIGLVYQGDTVVVLEDPPGGDWIRILYNGTEGWVYAPLFEAR